MVRPNVSGCLDSGVGRSGITNLISNPDENLPSDL